MRRLSSPLSLLLPSLLATLALAQPAGAHPMPTSSVLLRFDRKTVEAEVALPIIELALGWEKPLPGDPAEAVARFGDELKGYVLAHVKAVAPDGRAWGVEVLEVAALEVAEPSIGVKLRMTPPPEGPADRLTLRYDAILDHLVTHSAIVMVASDWRNGLAGGEPELIGTLRDTETSVDIDRSGGSWLKGFASMFRLGARHIAEGTDHLLFLLALLLPAPLVAEGGRWGGFAGIGVALRRIARIVTAFTLGHSITLGLGALGYVHLPVRLVESAVAASIGVSAVHAVVPILRGREATIAAGFGLVHGLAFAETLTGFGLDPWTMASSVLGFNLGIEAFQLLAILVAVPGLVLLARTRFEKPMRIAGATLIACASAWYLAEASGAAGPSGSAAPIEQTDGTFPHAALSMRMPLAVDDRPGGAKENPLIEELDRGGPNHHRPRGVIVGLIEKVTDALRRSFHDKSVAPYVRLEDDDGITGYVVSSRFRGVTSLDRQDMIGRAIDEAPDPLSPAERRKVVMIAGLTPAESEAAGGHVRIHRLKQLGDGSIEVLLRGGKQDADYVRAALKAIKNVETTEPEDSPGVRGILMTFRAHATGRDPLTEAAVRRVFKSDPYILLMPNA